ncbi:multidrug transporter [Bacillus sp. FJAT-27225]|uniref:DMT family transporter n=1 Tax=Bacillus sp. FJAT-27225 TaxID=1743144 RepID=UPI00080C2206|nr:DMT family transporter [Bacillus sp. FJAT-27225]OCA90552.1 multidrug transporter [Bacillus sp. FJAT-27225]
MRLKGLIMIIIGSALWGMTGPMMEWLLNDTGVTVAFLLSIRLLISGCLLLTVVAFSKTPIFEVWKSGFWRLRLIIFSMIGMLGLQYTFVAAIAASNAVMATLLQFSAPIFIIIFVSLKARKLPRNKQLIGVTGTLAGLFFLLTNGSLDNLVVSREALIWGLLLGLSFAFYALYPLRLMNEWGVLNIVGWSMFIAGCTLSLTTRVWSSNGWSAIANWETVGMFVILIGFGTMAFVLTLGSLQYITPVENSILGSVEPLTAMVISVIWFGTVLQEIQLFGAFLMLTFIIWLSVIKDRQAVPAEL